MAKVEFLCSVASISAHTFPCEWRSIVCVLRYVTLGVYAAPGSPIQNPRRSWASCSRPVFTYEPWNKASSVSRVRFVSVQTRRRRERTRERGSAWPLVYARVLCFDEQLIRGTLLVQRVPTTRSSIAATVILFSFFFLFSPSDFTRRDSRRSPAYRKHDGLFYWPTRR